MGASSILLVGQPSRVEVMIVAVGGERHVGKNYGWRDEWEERTDLGTAGLSRVLRGMFCWGGGRRSRDGSLEEGQMPAVVITAWSGHVAGDCARGT